MGKLHISEPLKAASIHHRKIYCTSAIFLSLDLPQSYWTQTCLSEYFAAHLPDLAAFCWSAFLNINAIDGIQAYTIASSLSCKSHKQKLSWSTPELCGIVDFCCRQAFTGNPGIFRDVPQVQVFTAMQMKGPLLLYHFVLFGQKKRGSDLIQPT